MQSYYEYEELGYDNKISKRTVRNTLKHDARHLKEISSENATHLLAQFCVPLRVSCRNAHRNGEKSGLLFLEEYSFD